VIQLHYQYAQGCGYTLMRNEAPLARCVAGRRLNDRDNLLLAQCGVVTTAPLFPNDRLRLQDNARGDPADTGRYVFVPAAPADIAASNFWGVVKLADLPR